MRIVATCAVCILGLLVYSQTAAVFCQGITVEMNLPNYFVNEDDGSVQVCASVVSENLEGTVYLNMSTTDMSATSVSPFDFSAISTEILFNETTSTVCMDILIADDDIVEDPEKFTVGISSFNTDVEYTTQTSNVTITDNDKAVIGFEMEVYKGNEGRMVDVCAMVRNNNTLERSILVIVSIEDVSTNGSEDYDYGRSELSFNFVQYRDCITITFKADNKSENTEELQVVLISENGDPVDFYLKRAKVFVWDDDSNFPGSVRLVARNGRTSSTLTAGRLEVYYKGQWGTVCDRSFGALEAHTACRQLGFSSDSLGYGTVGRSVLGFPSASSSTPIWLDDLSCPRFFNESSLDRCRTKNVGNHGCRHSDDVTLSCLGNGAVRLSRHVFSNAGLLEVYYNGVWGTVCDDDFGQTEADVACRQLGYISASQYGSVELLGYSSGSDTRIWLDNLQCTSSDLMLSTCSHRGFGNEDCSHSEDVAVSCSFNVRPVSGSVRLVARNGQTSPNLTAGRLEIFYKNQWGTVCNDSFGASEARTACRQLGFSSGYLNYDIAGGSVLGFPSASSFTPIWLDELSCSSNDTSLSQCTSRGIGVHDCGHNGDVTLSCLGNGALRLSNLSSISGRVEVYYEGEWGTVCDDHFGATDADVACRQLGYASASTYGSVRSLGYSQGSGTIWLDDLLCTSSDLMLSTCSHSGFGNEDCVHSEDVAVSCGSNVHPISGSVRLVARNGQTSPSLTAGRLEVYYNRQWGTVCHDGFGASEARTACRQLGFSSGYLNYGTAGGRVLGFPSASRFIPIWLDDLTCYSSHTSLNQCLRSGIGVHNCRHDEDVTLSCLGNGALRLSGSGYSSSGRVEVYYKGVWGAVCDDHFGSTDADVACSQLGYVSASNYGSVGSLGYSQGSGIIWLDDLRCTSSDLMLSTCSPRGFGSENCSHSEDVAVSCSSNVRNPLVSGSVRLVARNGQTSPSLTAGRLEVYYNNQWGTVCNDNFGASEAHTACRQLGFSSGYIKYGTAGGEVLGFPSASNSTPIWMDELSCSSNDIYLSQCTNRGIGVHDCEHNEDVTLSCLGNGALRLSGPGYSSSGRVEVYYEKVWGTVCDDHFGATDADVACRQLGYVSASNYGSVGSLGYSQGSGTTWLDDLHCTSSDLMLSTCSHRGFGIENCFHSEDVAVSCTPSTGFGGRTHVQALSDTTIILLSVCIPFTFGIMVLSPVVTVLIIKYDCNKAGDTRPINRSRNVTNTDMTLQSHSEQVELQQYQTADSGQTADPTHSAGDK